MREFKVQHTSFTIEINGQNYKLNHVDSFSETDSFAKHLTRGMNNTFSSPGISYGEGFSTPKVLSLVVLHLNVEFVNLLHKCWEDETRISLKIVDEQDGSTVTYDYCILQQDPYQRGITEGRDALTVALILESFARSSKMKEIQVQDKDDTANY